MSSFTDFPSISRQELSNLKKTIDGWFRDFSREYGDRIEHFFDPLLSFLIAFEKLLLSTPWPIIILAITGLAWLGSRNWKVTLGTLIAFLGIGYLGMWEDSLSTIAIVSVAAIICIALGLPIGIIMAKSDRFQDSISPILDLMQTIPPFVYLIPVVMLLGIGKVPGLLAVCIYAIPPIIRLTNLGIRLVNQEVIEAATAFGANAFQRLIHVQIPLALPNIFIGINQTIMMALSMVVIASMIGVSGLGASVLKAITNQYLTLGLMNGLAIVALAVIFSRITQAYGDRAQRYTDEYK